MKASVAVEGAALSQVSLRAVTGYRFTFGV